MVAQQERIFLVNRFADDVRMARHRRSWPKKSWVRIAGMMPPFRKYGAGAFYGELTFKLPMRASQCRPMIYNRLSVFSAAPRTLRKLLFWASLPRKKEARMSAIKLTKREKSWIVYDVGNSAFVLLASTLIPLLLGDCRPRQLCCSGLGLCNYGGVAFARVAHAVFGQYRRLEGQQETLARGLHWHGRRAARMHGAFPATRWCS